MLGKATRAVLMGGTIIGAVNRASDVLAAALLEEEAAQGLHSKCCKSRWIK